MPDSAAMPLTRGRRLIGVLGGMGPAATVDFLAKIIAATPAERDQDHVPVVIRNVPQIPDRSAAILAGTDAPLPAMLAGLKALEAAGAQVLAIPCNTAHHWYPALAAASPRPILHIVEAVLERLEADATPLGLMATRGTVSAGVYGDRLGDRLVPPDDATQAAVDAAIAAVKRGEDGRSFAEEAVARLLDRGARRVILGCTELPVTLADSAFGDYCIDATWALAEACVAASWAEAS
jgi:aspartate racemase